MPLHNFEELEVWKRGCRVSVDVLKRIESLKLFALREQMARSSISMASNIAEGAEREGDKEFRRFLRIAKGSAGELRTQIYIGLRSGHFNENQVKPIIHELREISSMPRGLIKSLNVPD